MIFYAFMNSFFPSVTDIWNKLSDSITNATNMHDFKDRLTHNNIYNQGIY